MVRFRGYVRRRLNRQARRFGRDLADRHDGPIIDAREPGLRGWLKSLSLGQFMLLCIFGGVAFLCALPVLGILALILWDQYRPSMVAAGWWH